MLGRLRDRFPLEGNPAAGWLEESLCAGDRIAVAFSGGPDSLLLLLWWQAWFPQCEDSTLVLHFDHGTRAGESGNDAKRAQKMAESLGFAFEAGKRRKAGGDSEDELRRERFSFFEEVMQREGIRFLLLGHQADDVVETFLARAAAGSGPEGLAAPRPVSHHRDSPEHWRIRPLLSHGSKKIRMFLEAEGFDFLEDASNRSFAYLRNRLRAEVVPVWKKAFPDRDLLAGVARTRMLFEEASDFIEEAVERAIPSGLRREALSVSRLGENHPALIRFALQRWLSYQGVRLSPSRVGELIGAVRSGGRGDWKASAGRDSWVVLADGSLQVERQIGTFSWSAEGMIPGQRLFLPDGGVVSATLVAAEPELLQRISEGEVDPSEQAFLSVRDTRRPLIMVRQRLPGDRYRALGSPGRRKLKDCLIDRKVPRRVREQLPVMEIGGRIVWVPGLPPEDSCRVSGSEEILLGLTYDSS